MTFDQTKSDSGTSAAPSKLRMTYTEFLDKSPMTGFLWLLISGMCLAQLLDGMDFMATTFALPGISADVVDAAAPMDQTVAFLRRDLQCVMTPTNVTGGGTAGSLTGFSVFDQAYGMINSPQSPVQLAATYMQVNFFRH